ncbi:hypothetical protein GCU56_18805 [Geodermatophilus sabuli]|uniref:Glycosyl hydrolase family 98 putative carbohydrate-binding module domain-containing protein n=1 Tax=Geodermatophilus sabuli TaxID=1564158 RepID=A0A7K3W4U2_9ACTN|nr:hypothetical protein [Geodermatophilus sabuli]NEK59909.1 hypothetical protein [Geodermatophilus sabuli]
MTAADEIRWDSGGTWWWWNETVQMNGRDYTRALMNCGSPDNPAECSFVSANYGSMELVVPSRRSALTAMLGLSDDSSQDCDVDVAIVLNGEPWSSFSLSRGTYEDLTVPLDGIQQVKIDTRFEGGVGCKVAFGDATWS